MEGGRADCRWAWHCCCPEAASTRDMPCGWSLLLLRLLPQLIGWLLSSVASHTSRSQQCGTTPLSLPPAVVAPPLAGYCSAARCLNAAYPPAVPPLHCCHVWPYRCAARPARSSRAASTTASSSLDASVGLSTANMPDTTAAPAQPAAMVSAAFEALTPPMETTGVGGGRFRGGLII